MEYVKQNTKDIKNTKEGRDSSLKYILGLGLGGGALWYLLTRKGKAEVPKVLEGKREGSELIIQAEIVNSQDGVSQNYGIGGSIMDSSGAVYDIWDGFLSFSKIKLSPGEGIDSRYIGAGETITHIFVAVLPKLASGEIKARVSVWKEDKLPLVTRLADTGWISSNLNFVTSGPGVSIKSVRFF